VQPRILAATLLLASCVSAPLDPDLEADFSSPGSVAQAWWDALASDNVDAAMSYMHPDGVHTREALGKSHSPFTGVRVTGVELMGSGRYAEATVVFQRHGVEQQTTTILVLENNRWWIQL